MDVAMPQSYLNFFNFINLIHFLCAFDGGSIYKTDIVPHILGP